jgi:hypothetical protein
MRILGWIVTFIALFILASIWSGYVLSVLWAWFLVPAFHVTSINIALAIGVSIVIRMLTFQVNQERDEKKERSKTELWTQTLVWSFLYPLLALGMGAIVHQFI